jgi:hypothetical protein
MVEPFTIESNKICTVYPAVRASGFVTGWNARCSHFLAHSTAFNLGRAFLDMRVNDLLHGPANHAMKSSRVILISLFRVPASLYSLHYFGSKEFVIGLIFLRCMSRH